MTDKQNLLIVEDDLGLQKQLKWCFTDYEVAFASDRAGAMAALRRYEPAVVLQDLGLPPDAEGVTEGMATLRELLTAAPDTKVIVVTGNHDRGNALEAVSRGAYDFCPKPVDPDVLKLIVSRAFHIHAIEAQSRQLLEANSSTPIDGIVATDDAMLTVCRRIEKVAPADVSVLITGESGTGKELVARAIHALSGRRSKPFVAINCAAIPEQLLESELFGHEKGAFTGAVKQTLGKVEQAEGGTLFLDEIGDMPIALQAKLLRFLQNRVIERIGGRQEIPINVRVVCATHQDLAAMIVTQQFRQDLFYRLAEVSISIPPLRDRRGGAAVIAQSILRKHAAISGKQKRGFAPDAIAAIEAYAWPGNVRELENKIKTALIMADGVVITATDLGLSATNDARMSFNLRDVRMRAEKQAICNALEFANGNMTVCAELLGITRPTLYDLMEKYSLKPADRDKDQVSNDH